MRGVLTIPLGSFYTRCIRSEQGHNANMIHPVTNTNTTRVVAFEHVDAVSTLMAEMLAAAELAEMAALERQTDNTVAYAARMALEKAEQLSAAIDAMWPAAA